MLLDVLEFPSGYLLFDILPCYLSWLSQNVDFYSYSNNNNTPYYSTEVDKNVFHISAN